MGVSEQLGVSCRETPEFTLAAWLGWVELHPGLAAVGDPEGLRGWLRSVGPAESDEVLVDLATLAAVDGGNDTDAARTLAWVLAPAASGLARRLLSPRGDTDQVVARELWVAVRTFPWRRLRKVAANILATVRTAVLVDRGVGREARRLDPTWAASDVLEDVALPEVVEPAELPAWRELDQILAMAVAEGVVSSGDIELLLRLATEADQHPGASVRERGGLMATTVCEAVGLELGCSARTVRRRCHRILEALVAASTELASAA